MQTLSLIKTIFINTLQHLEDEVEPLFYYALESIHHLKRSDYLLNPQCVLTNEHIIVWQNLINHLKSDQPIQYFFNSQNFYGLDFFVDQNTLIPRPETEELVAWMILNHQNQTIKIIDIGTGSGCIAITLAKHLPQAQVYALDVSENALEVAKKNAGTHQVDVQFIQKNLLTTDDLAQTFDVIVSNPPYVRLQEKEAMKPNVLNHEPHLALFVPDENPMIFYDKILNLAKKNLAPHGHIYFEINQYLGKNMMELFENNGFQPTLKKDLKGNDRMMHGVRI
jgi:release factor glutamine methyltransferase